MRVRVLVRTTLIAGLAAVLLYPGPGASQAKKEGARLQGTAKPGEDTKNSGPQVVAKILSVDYVELEINPPTLRVTAVGEVPTLGYTAVLNRVMYVTPPKDGIQDYVLMATPPDKPSGSAISQVTGKDEWPKYKQEAPWIKGIRVHGVGDGVVEVKFRYR